MAKEVPVFSILQLFFTNIFSLLLVFVFGFMFSYFFSSDLLENKYTSKSFIAIGRIGDQALGSVGNVLNQFNSSSFNTILQENYDAPEDYRYKIRVSEDNASQLEVVVTSKNPEDGLQVQNILLSMIRDLEENKYNEYIQNLSLKIAQNENLIKRYKLDLEKIAEDIKALPAPEGGVSGAFVVLTNVFNNQKGKMEEAQRNIDSDKRRIETAKRTHYITSPKVGKLSYPNSKTHLGVGFLLTLLSIIYLLYRGFKKSTEIVH